MAIFEWYFLRAFLVAHFRFRLKIRHEKSGGKMHWRWGKHQNARNAIELVDESCVFSTRYGTLATIFFATFLRYLKSKGHTFTCRTFFASMAFFLKILGRVPKMRHLVLLWQCEVEFTWGRPGHSTTGCGLEIPLLYEVKTLSKPVCKTLFNCFE